MQLKRLRGCIIYRPLYAIIIFFLIMALGWFYMYNITWRGLACVAYL